MSTDTHKWIGSYPQTQKEKKMWQTFGKQELSQTSAIPSSKRVILQRSDQRHFADMFNIASVMSLWQKSEAQVSSTEAPQQIQISRAEEDALHLPKRTGSTTPPSIFAKSPAYYRTKQGYRSNGNGLCVSSYKTFDLREKTNFPDNPSEGRINELEILKDFGNDFRTICDDSTSISASDSFGQLLQNCRNQAWKRGDCETVVTSTTKKTNKPESKYIHNCSESKAECKNNLPSSCEVVLGVLPLLSLLQVKNISELVFSYINGIKKLISYAISLRVFLLGSIITREKNNKIELSAIGADLVVQDKLPVMEFRGEMGDIIDFGHGGVREGDDDEFEGQDEMGDAPVPPPLVPDFANFRYDEDEDVEGYEFDVPLVGGRGRLGRQGNERVVPEFDDEEAAKRLHHLDEFIIYDHERIAAYMAEGNDLAQEDPAPIPIPENIPDHWMEEAVDLNLLVVDIDMDNFDPANAA